MKERMSGIRLVLFSSENDVHLKRILSCIPDFFSEKQVLPCADPKGMASALQGVLSGHGIALILLRNLHEIEAVMPLREMLREHLVILVLDNADGDLTRQALRLYPRYTSCFKADYQDVFMVMGKMITKIENTIRRQENDPGN